MKLNKKGLTLIEILVSVGLISAVMIFLFNLMLDLRFDSEYGLYDKANRINRITIVKVIESDFINKGVRLGSISNSFNSSHQLVIPFEDGTSTTLEVNENYIRYGNNKWLISQDNDFDVYDVNNLRVELSNPSYGEYRTLKIVIPVKTDKDSNIILDDLELYYIGYNT